MKLTVKLSTAESNRVNLNVARLLMMREEDGHGKSDDEFSFKGALIRRVIYERARDGFERFPACMPMTQWKDGKPPVEEAHHTPKYRETFSPSDEPNGLRKFTHMQVTFYIDAEANIVRMEYHGDGNALLAIQRAMESASAVARFGTSKPTEEPDWHALGLRRPDEHEMTRTSAPRLKGYTWLMPTEAVYAPSEGFQDPPDQVAIWVRWLKGKGCGLDASKPIEEAQGF